MARLGVRIFDEDGVHGVWCDHCTQYVAFGTAERPISARKLRKVRDGHEQAHERWRAQLYGGKSW